MSVRTNVLILSTVVAATFAVGLIGMQVANSATVDPAKTNRVFSATLDCGAVTCTAPADAFVTLQYRGPNMSILARVPVQ